MSNSKKETYPPDIDLDKYRKVEGIDADTVYDLTEDGLIDALESCPLEGDDGYDQVSELIEWAWAAQEALSRYAGELRHIKISNSSIRNNHIWK